MKITRVLTYNISEDYVRDFFDNCWWEDKTEPDEIDYDFFIDGLREEGYDNEEILPDQGTKEKIMQIWQEECDKYHRELENPTAIKEQIAEELQHYRSEMEYYKNKVAQLEKQLKDA
jgi:septin family protein